MTGGNSMGGKVLCQTIRLELEYLYDEDGKRLPYYTELKRIQEQVYLADNRTIQILWEWDNYSVFYKREHGVAPKAIDFSNGQGSIRGYVYDILKTEFPDWYSGNLTTSIQQTLASYKEVRKDVQAGKRSITSYKKDAPIDIHNACISFEFEGGNAAVSLKVFSEPFRKACGYGSTTVTFKVKKLGKAVREIIELCARGTNGYAFGASKLIYNAKKDCWFLHLAYKFLARENENLDPNHIMGVDLGIKYAAYMGFNHSPERYYIKGGEVETFRHKVEARKRSLQEQGKYCGDGRIGHGYQTRMKPVQKLSDSIARFRDTANHKYSRYIVDMAVKHGCGKIQVEDLSNIKDRQDKFLQEWTYFDLQQKIKYKAEAEGIEVVKVAPHHTSQRCSQCGYIDENNRPSQSEFKCGRCGFTANADYNASLNLATAGIEELIAEELRAKRKNASKH